jgi:antitoxin (DNA-binding transcriptional repressor) of toxin-antitoxin stability system
MSDFITQSDNTGGLAGGNTVVMQTATSVSTGSAVTITKQGRPHAYVVTGTFVGTIKVEVSMDGTTWYVLASYTAPAVLESTGPWKYVRGNCTAFTSGTITLSKISF